MVVVGKKKTPKVLRQGEGMEGRKKKERVRKKAAKIYFKEKGSETDTRIKERTKKERKKGRQKHRERKRERENREMKEEIKKEQTKFESKGIKEGNDFVLIF